jgi:L-lysine exporter family protein LysE/ArgO
MIRVFLEGAFLQASLIFAIGPQNIFILESGLKRDHHLMVSLVCFFCDLVLITLGVSFTGILFLKYPLMKILIASVGILFLLSYSFLKLKMNIIEFNNGGIDRKLSFKHAITGSIFFSLLNPHSYIDALVLIGGYSSKYSDQSTRMIFGFGAASFSLIWFLFLAFFASFMIVSMNQKRLLSYSSKAVAILMILFALNLSINLIDWTKDYLRS